MPISGPDYDHVRASSVSTLLLRSKAIVVEWGDVVYLHPPDSN